MRHTFLLLFLWNVFFAGCTGNVSNLPPDGVDGSDANDGDDGGQVQDGGDMIQGDDGATAGDDGPEPCPAGQHRCGGQCVSDDSVDHCGDRCDPCPAVENGTPTCDGVACGFTCLATFLPCLGECIPEAEGPCGVNIPANTFVHLTTGDTGPRTSAAMFYLESTAEYVLVGGSLPISAVPRPYDIQSLKLSESVWKNRYPLGKVGVWGPETGDCSAPGFGTEHFVTEDSEGNTRPNWSTYPGIPCYFQYAWDANSNSLFFYLWNRTFSYNAVSREWTFHSPADDPAGGPGNPRPLWGAMAFDPAGGKTLLFGGGNVLNDQGRPDTWIYEVAASTWRRVSGPEPGPRALGSMVADPDRRKALLFGGDELDRLVADTWAFDFATETWEQLHPAVSPAPRGGHHLLFLPTSRRIVALGGFGYSSTTDYVASHYARLPWEIWRFDWDTPGWELIKRFDPAEDQPEVAASRNLSHGAAAGTGDVVVAHFKFGYAGEMDRSETWALRIDAGVTDAAGTAAYGVGPGAEEWRGGPYHPDWYTEGVPDPDPVAFAALLDSIGENTWTEIEVPNRPAHNHDWGTAALDPIREVIFRWSGGHSAHSGTDVLEYDMVTNRYSLSYPAEIPLDFEYTNDQTPGHWSFDNNPFMTGHTYKTYAYSTAVGKMVVFKNPYTYYYDPDLHDFELNPGHTDGGGNMYTTVLCPTPEGMTAWTPDGLWGLDIPTGTWSQLTVTGDSLPSMSPDRNILVHDSARDRLLLFTSTGEDLGQVFAYDRGSGVLSALNPAGQAAVHENGSSFIREAVYVPGHDLVVIGAGYDAGGAVRTPVYHAGENRWYAYHFDGGGIQDGIYGVSLGLMIDADERIWAVNTSSQLFLLKVDPSTADKLAL